jgi:hypothetical protein
MVEAAPGASVLSKAGVPDTEPVLRCPAPPIEGLGPLRDEERLRRGIREELERQLEDDGGRSTDIPEKNNKFK